MYICYTHSTVHVYLLYTYYCTCISVIHTVLYMYICYTHSTVHVYLLYTQYCTCISVIHIVLFMYICYTHSTVHVYLLYTYYCSCIFVIHILLFMYICFTHSTVHVYLLYTWYCTYYLLQDYLPVCRQKASASSLPGGDKYYEAALRYYTADYVTPQYAHQLGLNETQRITTEMKQV